MSTHNQLCWKTLSEFVVGNWQHSVGTCPGMMVLSQLMPSSVAVQWKETKEQVENSVVFNCLLIIC